MFILCAEHLFYQDNYYMQDSPGEAWKFELYIIGDNRRSTLALENLREICKDYLGSRCQVDIIDLKKHPEEMAQKKICVAPTLIRKYPTPEKMLVGDLSQTSRVLQGLDIICPPAQPFRDTYCYGLSRQGLSSKWDHVPH
jgi:circadian clock protein KaiB